MKRIRQNSKRKQEVINNAYDGKQKRGFTVYTNKQLRDILDQPSIDVIWDNENGTYSALGFEIEIEFKSK